MEIGPDKTKVITNIPGEVKIKYQALETVWEQHVLEINHDDLTMVKKRKLGWYGHIGMVKTILKGTLKGAM